MYCKYFRLVEKHIKVYNLVNNEEWTEEWTDIRSYFMCDVTGYCTDKEYFTSQAMCKECPFNDLSLDEISREIYNTNT